MSGGLLLKCMGTKQANRNGMLLPEIRCCRICCNEHRLYFILLDKVKKVVAVLSWDLKMTVHRFNHKWRSCNFSPQWPAIDSSKGSSTYRFVGVKSGKFTTGAGHAVTRPRLCPPVAIDCGIDMVVFSTLTAHMQLGTQGWFAPGRWGGSRSVAQYNECLLWGFMHQADCCGSCPSWARGLDCWFGALRLLFVLFPNAKIFSAAYFSPFPWVVRVFSREAGQACPVGIFNCNENFIHSPLCSGEKHIWS